MPKTCDHDQGTFAKYGVLYCKVCRREVPTPEYPALTMEQVQATSMFHHNRYVNSDGTCQRYRSNGDMQTWKRDPNRFRQPIKYGLKGYAQLTQSDTDQFHRPEDCKRASGT